jgi:cytochrome c oxidase cbb3-type subunit 1
MNSAETKEISLAQIDASCRVPLLALFVGAAVWLVAGLALALVAAMTFHQPDTFAGCSFLTYGHVAPAANDLILYGFCVPAGLGVILWIFARLSRAELALPIVPVVAAHIWHLAVFIGTVAILVGDSTGFTWLEYPRSSTVLLFTAFVLIAVSAMATFGARTVRELYPAHWFLLASLVWFPWILSSTDLFLLAWRVRGGAQPVIDWWFANNLVFVWLGLVGIGTAFYFLPKLTGRPLQSHFFALFAFWTFILFGTWCGIPVGAPVPAWLPSASTLASALLVIPIIAVAIIARRTVKGAAVVCKGGPLCFVRVGTLAFVISGVLTVATACPHFSRLTEFTWFDFGRVQLQLLGFFAMVIFGAIYELLPKIMGTALPFPKFVRGHIWLCWIGLVLFIVPLLWAGVSQSKAEFDPTAPLMMLRISSTGLAVLLLGSLLFLANILILALQWHIALIKTVFAAVTAPLENAEVKP